MVENDDLREKVEKKLINKGHIVLERTEPVQEPDCLHPSYLTW